MTAYEKLRDEMRARPKRWLVTGVAGFIGSNLLQELLGLDQKVVGLDNFSTGNLKNLVDVKAMVGERRWAQFDFIEGDICDLATCRTACKGVDVILHQAALGSVPRSIENPLATNESNVTGSLNMLKAACDAGVKRFVYASSSAVYGDHPGLPKVETVCGQPLSPYAVSKMVNELYGHVFAQLYGLETIGLRYFNVFGPRQDREGAYAAVIPRWIAALHAGEPVYINGDGSTSRDFCYIANVVQANLLAGMTSNREAVNQVYNIALNQRTTLTELYDKLIASMNPHLNQPLEHKAVYRDFRAGDVLHSQADIGKAVKLLGYMPSHTVDSGLETAMGWYMKNLTYSVQQSR